MEDTQISPNAQNIVMSLNLSRTQNLLAGYSPQREN